MIRRIRRQPVSCEQRDVDRFGRIVAVCYNVCGSDIGRAKVRRGWALAFRQFSLGYVVAEGRAKAAKSGIGTTMFLAPWACRRKQRRWKHRG